MEQLKLFMFLLGCKPPGRHTEQHDVFFTIGNSVAAVKQDIIDFWPEANGKIHIDAWRTVTMVEGYQLKVVPADEKTGEQPDKLFFLNLGGYKKGEFDELHYQLLIVADSLGTASKTAKETAFYKHTGFEGAVSHIDDKYGVDVDDVFEIADVLPPGVKSKYRLQLEAVPDGPADEMHLGYLPLSRL
jgi:hypothetical protein